MLTIVPAVLGSVALFGGWLSDHLGPRLPTVGGMLLAAAGLAVIAYGADRELAALVPGLALLGLGAGLFIPANNASVMAAAPNTHLGVAGGLLNVMRGLGTSFGVAIVGMILALYAGSVSTDQVASATLIDAFRTTILCLLVAALVAGLLAAGRRNVRRSSGTKRAGALEL
jgi:MFS family permease